MSKEKIEEKELTDKQESQEKDQTTGQNTDGQDKEEQTGSEEESIKSEIARLENELAKEKDDYIRLMAEFDNFRRRTSQEKLDLVAVASMDTIKGLLPVLDDCERALAVLEKSEDSQAAKEGTNLIYSKLMGYLQSKGLATIPAKDQEVNTDLHEAVAQFPVQEEEKKGKIFDVVQTGYTLNGKVIRYAKVVVGI